MEASVGEVPESCPPINLNQNSPNRPVASTGPSFPALPREACNARINANDTAASRTCETLPLRVTRARSAQNSLSALSNVLSMSCVAVGRERSLSPDIPIGRAIAVT
jgi:hypothetical protein